MSDLTGWNLDAAAVTVGKDGVTVAWADTCALYTGPAEPQKEGFHMYDANQLAYTLLDSVKRTIQCAFSPPTRTASTSGSAPPTAAPSSWTTWASPCPLTSPIPTACWTVS